MIQKVKESIDAHLAPKCHFVYLLGSVGTERFRDDSDIDIAAYFVNPPTFKELVRLQSEIENDLGRDVDLVALNKADPIYARQVLESGRLVYMANNQVEHLKWQTYNLSMYPDFKQSREVIENSLLNRKKYV